MAPKEYWFGRIRFVDSPANGLTLCSGSLGADPGNNIEALVREFGALGRIHFAHLRNVKVESDGSFYESSHRSGDGSLDMAAIVKAYCDVGFNGYVRPDHGRMIWGETGKPGYGLYDRALGAVYLNGLWEATAKLGSLSTTIVDCDSESALHLQTSDLTVKPIGRTLG